MKPSRQILIELIAAAIFLAIFLPHVPELSANAMGWTPEARKHHALLVKENSDWMEALNILKKEIERNPNWLLRTQHRCAEPFHESHLSLEHAVCAYFRVTPVDQTRPPQ